MTTLYIIGNGFDLYHSLPTGYIDFYEFGKELLDEIEEFYLLEISSANPWSDFENTLGKFDWKEFRDSQYNPETKDDNFKYSELYGALDEQQARADGYVEDIKEYYQRWVEEIDIQSVERVLTLEENSYFITFNYTSTLQKIYGIKDENILHIHGSVDKPDDLIFGHGETMEEEFEFDADGESNHTIFSDIDAAATYPFYALKKPVDEVLERHKSFFASLKNIQEVIVIGHSINKIDWPYFEKIARNAPDARWTYCLRDDERMCEEIKYIFKLSECGVHRDNIRFTRYAYLALRA